MLEKSILIQKSVKLTGVKKKSLFLKLVFLLGQHMVAISANKQSTSEPLDPYQYPAPTLAPTLVPTTTLSPSASFAPTSLMRNSWGKTNIIEVSVYFGVSVFLLILAGIYDMLKKNANSQSIEIDSSTDGYQVFEDLGQPQSQDDRVGLQESQDHLMPGSQ